VFKICLLNLDEAYKTTITLTRSTLEQTLISALFLAKKLVKY